MLQPEEARAARRSKSARVFDLTVSKVLNTAWRRWSRLEIHFRHSIAAYTQCPTEALEVTFPSWFGDVGASLHTRIVFQTPVVVGSQQRMTGLWGAHAHSRQPGVLLACQHSDVELGCLQISCDTDERMRKADHQ